jgi:hypothetical protein
MKTENIPTLKPIKDHRGFIITEEQYIEEPHPQYNYLGFRAKNDVGQGLEIVFHDIDMRVMTRDELLNIFLKRLDRFIEEIGGIY